MLLRKVTIKIVYKCAVCIFLLGLWGGMPLQAQKPYWITHLPKPKSGNFYYRVTSAEGNTYEKAYTKAFAMAILESSWKHGVEVRKNEDMDSLEKSISESINVQPKEIRLPLNKVCEYVEKTSGSMRMRIYILWQVGKTSSNPQFEDFTDCE